MKGVSEMRLDQGGQGQGPGPSIDAVPAPPAALSMALKQRRLAKAQKRRLVDTNSPMDNPSQVPDPTPTEE